MKVNAFLHVIDKRIKNMYGEDVPEREAYLDIDVKLVFLSTFFKNYKNFHFHKKLLK